MPIKRDLSLYFADVDATAKTFEKQRKSYKIENLFVPTYKDGKFTTVIRFLPSHPDEIKPFIENRTHMFKLANGQWFGCDCLGKFGKPCPICEYNREQYKKYTLEEARSHTLGKARSRYVCNILVVRNPNNLETEGKVFRFEFGTQIMKMIMDAMTDKDDGLTVTKKINPFDWKLGANFVYEGVQSSNGPKLNSSHFGPQQTINRWDASTKQFIEMSDAEIDVIESQLYKLDECCHKEADVPDYNRILERYEQKAGKTLFEGIPSTFASKPAAAVNLFASSAPATKTVPDIDANDLNFNTPVTPTVPSTPLDSADFWATVNADQQSA